MTALRVHASRFSECVTSGVIELRIPTYIVPSDPRPVKLMPLRYRRRGVYFPTEVPGEYRSVSCR